MKPLPMHSLFGPPAFAGTDRDSREFRPSFLRKRESMMTFMMEVDSRFRGNDGSSIHATIRGALPWTRGDSLRRVAGGLGIALSEGGEEPAPQKTMRQ